MVSLEYYVNTYTFRNEKCMLTILTFKPHKMLQISHCYKHAQFYVEAKQLILENLNLKNPYQTET